MGFYIVVGSFLLRLPYGKWVLLGWTVGCGLKNYNFFTRVLWPLLSVLLIKLAITLDSHRGTGPSSLSHNSLSLPVRSRGQETQQRRR